MAISAEHKSKFAALHRQLWRFQMSEKFSSGTKNHKETNNHVKDNNLLGELGTFFLVSEEENACNCKVAGEILKFEYWSLVNGSFLDE